MTEEWIDRILRSDLARHSPDVARQMIEEARPPAVVSSILEGGDESASDQSAE